MGTANDRADGIRLRALIVVLWRAGLRISEALALAETDMDARRGAVLIRHGKGDKRREVGIDRTAALAGVRRRFAPRQLRHAHAVEMAHEGPWNEPSARVFGTPLPRSLLTLVTSTPADVGERPLVRASGRRESAARAADGQSGRLGRARTRD
jgi:hypothetical protein